MGLGDYLVDWLGGNPDYNAKVAQNDARSKVQDIFSGLADAQTADANFNALAPANQSGPGAATPQLYRSALAQLAAADPQTYGDSAVKELDPMQELDATLKRAQAANYQAEAQRKDILTDPRTGETVAYDHNTGSKTPIFGGYTKPDATGLQPGYVWSSPQETQANGGQPFAKPISYTGQNGGQAGPLPTGDAYLKSLQPQTAALVKAAALGKLAPANLSRLGQPFMAMVTQYDPDFDAANYKTRQATAEDFSSKGQSGKVLTSTNTAASHLSDLIDAYNGLGNTGVRFINSAHNGLNDAESLTNPDRSAALAKFQTAVTNLAPELAKISSGKSNINEDEIHKQINNFDPASTPANFNAAVKEAASLIKGRTDSMLQTYQQNMGQKNTPETIQPFSANALKTFGDLGVDLTDTNSRIGGQAPQASQVATPNRPVGPKGQVIRSKSTGVSFISDGNQWVRQ